MVNEKNRNNYITLVVVGEKGIGYRVRKDNSQWWLDGVYVGGRKVLNRGSANTPFND